MKRAISVILSIVLVLSSIPVFAYTLNITPSVELNEFTAQLQELQAEYDDTAMFSTITLQNGTEFYYIDGEEYILENNGASVQAEITDNALSIPQSAIEQLAELPETTFYSTETVLDKQDLENFGFDVEIKDDTAVLTQPYQTERLIVKSKYDINPLDSVAMVEGYNDLHIVQFDNQESAKQAEEYYNKQKLIEYAEPDLVVSTMEYEDSTTSSFANAENTNGIIYDDRHLSWGSESIGIDDYIDYLGNVSELPEVVVGIIDTGVDLDHEFFKNRIIETGMNYSSSGTKNSEEDDNGHGTHVAGIIADNTTENVKIKAFKCLNAFGSGSLSNVVLSIYAAINSNVNVINMSLGSSKKGNSREENSSIEQAVKTAIENEITVCVAAGNSGANAINYTPACIDDCITVGAIGAYDDEPFWTNWGEVVDIVAPGVSIYSTYTDGEYKTLSGTSMATPFIAASSAMLLSKNINYSPTEISNLLVQNGREWTNDESYYLYGTKAVYIGNLSNFTTKERTSSPVFNFESGKYSDGIFVEISSDENAEIYYTLDGNRATNETGTLYTEPIYIDKVTTIHAVAYAPDKLKSLQSFADYYITFTDDESNFSIDSEGVITAYTGNSKYLTIPDTINGITVRAIGEKVFWYSSNRDIVMIKFPDTLTAVYESAFEVCDKLESVDCKNLKYAGRYAFYDCEKLRDINLDKLEYADDYAFAFCYSMPSLNNNKLTEIADYAFTGWDQAISINLPNVVKIGQEGLSWAVSLEHINIPKVEYLDCSALTATGVFDELYLPNLTAMDGKGGQFSKMDIKTIILPKYNGILPKNCFAYCKYLEDIYIPKAISLDDNALTGCSKLETIFAPYLENVSVKADLKNNITLYVTDKLTDLPIFNNCNFIIIAPETSYAEQWAIENGYTFTDSLSYKCVDYTDGMLTFQSDLSDNDLVIPTEVIKTMWNSDCINKAPEDYDTSHLFDVNNDGISNAKDFAILNKA